jgi:hypothetical protein
LHKRAFERELRLNAMQQLNLWKKELEEGVGKMVILQERREEESESESFWLL